MEFLNRKHVKLAVIALVFASGVFLLSATTLSAANFQINAMADQVASESAEGYVNGSVTGVTGALGSPSMVRMNRADAEKMDYIYIGTAQVCTFEVLKAEGKKVTAYKIEARGQWEGSTYPAYPAKASTPA